MEITVETKKVGLLGWPLGHSLSPAMHNAAFAASGLNYIYLPLPTPPELLPQAVAGLKALGFAGVNVTIPHKLAVMDYLDEIDDKARLVGAVNTIVIRENRLIGYNTDADGYIRSLKQAGVDLAGKSAVVLGAGGAARAVAAGLASSQIAAITFAARSCDKAANIATLFAGLVAASSAAWVSQEFNAALRTADLIVNTTPLGMYPASDSQPSIDWEILPKAAVISDLVYNPRLTGFLAEGAGRGHMTVGGEGMLLEQGALAFELWTGCKAPVDVMRQALVKGLG